MTVGELIWELMKCESPGNTRVEVMFNLHWNKRVLMPWYIKAIIDQKGKVCVLNLWDYA